MLKKLQNHLRRLFGIAAPKSAPKEDPARSAKPKRKRKKSARPAGEVETPVPSAAQRPERPERPERRERAERPRREPAPARIESAPAPRREIPVKPEALAEVAPCEGKVRFLDLPIHPDVQFGIQNLKFEYCTPIQALTFPPLFEGRDIAGKAQTGTGKTAAFLIATFTHLLNNPPRAERRPGRPRALVLAPTRELAIQIHKDAENLGIFTGLNCLVVFGGMDHEKQRRALGHMVDVVIGTPGRIIDFSRGTSLDLSQVETLIIDEADRMLDMGFIPDVKRIVAQLPRKGDRQTMLFSATLDESILRLASSWLVEPVTIESEPEKMVSENIEQTFYSVLREEKLALILHFIRTEEFERMLIFGNRKDINLRLQEELGRYGVEVPILSGDISQEKRIRILERFRTGEERIVIATDVAARGIHVDDVSIVINYDLPERAEDYVHRIGRTGRAGHQGKSISFLCEYGAYNLPAIEELLGTTFPSVQPDDAMVQLPAPIPGYRPPRREESEVRRGGDRRGGGRPGGNRGGGRSRRPFR